MSTSLEDLGFTFLTDGEDPGTSLDDLGINVISDEWDSTKKPSEETVNYPKELARSFVGGMTPALTTPGSTTQRELESLATPEELINLIETGDVLPSYTDIPQHHEIEDFLEKTFGIKDPSDKAKYAQRVGSALGTLLQSGGATPQAALAIGTGALAGEGVEQATDSPILGMITELVTGAGVGGLEGFLSKKPVNPLIAEGKRIGLPERIVTPLATSKAEKSLLGKFAKKGQKTENIVKDAEDALATAIGQLNNHAEQLPPLTLKQNEKMADALRDIGLDITKNLANTPDEKAALEFIKEAVNKLETIGSNPAEIENFYRTVNRNVNWNRMNRGDQYKAKIKDVIKDTFKEINPDFSKDFELINDFYTRFYDLEKALGQTDFEKAIRTFNTMRKIGQAGYALVTLDPWVGIELLGEEAFQIYARESLINPTVQRLNQSIVSAAKKGAETSVKSLTNKTLEYMHKQHPTVEFKIQS